MKRLLLALTLLPLMGCHYHQEKHTGPCTLMFVDQGGRFWFVRPNKELFLMWFDNPPMLPSRDLKDITYTDDNADMRHFVKAQLK